MYNHFLEVTNYHSNGSFFTLLLQTFGPKVSSENPIFVKTINCLSYVFVKLIKGAVACYTVVMVTFFSTKDCSDGVDS